MTDKKLKGIIKKTSVDSNEIYEAFLKIIAYGRRNSEERWRFVYTTSLSAEPILNKKEVNVEAEE